MRAGKGSRMKPEDTRQTIRRWPAFKKCTRIQLEDKAGGEEKPTETGKPIETAACLKHTLGCDGAVRQRGAVR